MGLDNNIRHKYVIWTETTTLNDHESRHGGSTPTQLFIRCEFVYYCVFSNVASHYCKHD